MFTSGIILAEKRHLHLACRGFLMTVVRAIIIKLSRPAVLSVCQIVLPIATEHMENTMRGKALEHYLPIKITEVVNYTPENLPTPVTTICPPPTMVGQQKSER